MYNDGFRIPFVTDIETEMTEGIPSFISTETNIKNPHRCGDGRAFAESELGPQMFGGSVFVVTMDSIYKNIPLDEELVAKDFGMLKDAGIGLGVHRDTHAHGEGSGCGFADKLPAIIQTIKDQEAEIRGVILSVYNVNKDKINLTDEQLNAALDNAFMKVQAYDITNIQITGDALISASEANGASTEVFTDEHTEQIVHFNLAPDTTFNTIEADKRGENGFNVDLWTVDPNARAVGIEDSEFSLGFALIASVATEIVLVENNGKQDRLPVAVNS